MASFHNPLECPDPRVKGNPGLKPLTPYQQRRLLKAQGQLVEGNMDEQLKAIRMLKGIQSHHALPVLVKALDRYADKYVHPREVVHQARLALIAQCHATAFDAVLGPRNGNRTGYDELGLEEWEELVRHAHKGNSAHVLHVITPGLNERTLFFKMRVALQEALASPHEDLAARSIARAYDAQERAEREVKAIQDNGAPGVPVRMLSEHSTQRSNNRIQRSWIASEFRDYLWNQIHNGPSARLGLYTRIARHLTTSQMQFYLLEWIRNRAHASPAPDQPRNPVLRTVALLDPFLFHVPTAAIPFPVRLKALDDALHAPPSRRIRTAAQASLYVAQLRDAQGKQHVK